MPTRATCTPHEVFKHHAEALIAVDLDGIVSDYPEDAVFITGAGVLHGKEGVREGFTRCSGIRPMLSGAWTRGSWKATCCSSSGRPRTAASRAEDGVETFLVRDGEIVLQTGHYTVQPA
jgi:hypothetical protein